MRQLFTALILLLVSAEITVAAQAQGENAGDRMITLSCDGTVSSAEDKAPKQIKDMNVVVDLSTRSVVGFGEVIANIDHIDTMGLSFSGKRRIESASQHAAPVSNVSVDWLYDPQRRPNNRKRNGHERDVEALVQKLRSSLPAHKQDAPHRQVKNLGDSLLLEQRFFAGLPAHYEKLCALSIGHARRR